jgi:hypothetical protein
VRRGSGDQQTAANDDKERQEFLGDRAGHVVTPLKEWRW